MHPLPSSTALMPSSTALMPSSTALMPSSTALMQCNACLLAMNRIEKCIPDELKLCHNFWAPHKASSLAVSQHCVSPARGPYIVSPTREGSCMKAVRMNCRAACGARSCGARPASSVGSHHAVQVKEVQGRVWGNDGADRG
jgi:hypothetical protein